MTAKNDITGDTIASKPGSDAYRSNYDLIFGQKKINTGIPPSNGWIIADALAHARLTDEQQRAVDDTAGLEEVNKK